MKQITNLFLLLFCLIGTQFMAQDPPPVTGVSCSVGTPSSYVFTEDFEYSSTDEAIANGGWSGRLDQNNNNPLYPKNGQWGICSDTQLRTGNTGPNNAQSGSKYLMFEANGSVNQAQVISPAIDLTYTSEDLELSFYMHAWGVDIGTLDVGVGTSAAGPFTTIFTQEGSYQNGWAPVGIDLSSYLGQVIYLSFDYTAGPENFGDIAIDFIRLQTCGEFCVPGNVRMSDLTDSSITLNWTPGSTQTQWEYFLQDQGAGAPTGNGTLAASNLVSLTSLLDGHSYEIYYRALCTTGFSDWSGPHPFTTALSYNKTIDCSADQYILNYCYKSVAWNGSPIEFTYTSSNGNPIMLFINEGVLGLSSFGSNDDLVVEDADGNVLYRGTGNNGNISGLSFRSDEISATSNVLRFYIDADTFGDCGKDNLTPINATVSCLTCSDIPEVTFTNEFASDCSTNPEYYLNANINSLGDTSSLIISDNLGLYSETADALGVVKIGPFDFNTKVQITVADATSSSCFTRSKTFNIDTCPPVNDQFVNATELTIGEFGNCTDGEVGTLIQATPSPSTIPEILCSDSLGDDIWYKFVATHTAHRIIFRDFYANEYLDHAFYKGDDSTNLEELYCYTNFDDYASNPTVLTPQLTIGDSYYVRVFAQNHGSQEFPFSICIQDPPPGGEDAICNLAEPLCLDETGTYKTTATTGIINYLKVGCLEWTANPTWMTFEVQESGPLDFTLSQIGGNSANDVDVAIFGPFESLDAICSDYLSMTPLACKSTNSGIEKLKLNNVLAGEKYLILSCNVSLYPHDLTVQQSNFGNEGAAVLKNRSKEPAILNPEPVCDNLGDGFETFELTVFDAELLDGDTSFMVSYHSSRIDAQDDVNAINSVDVEAGTTKAVFARVDTGSNAYCYKVTHFPLTVLENPIVNSISTDLICDNLDDGFEMIDLSDYSDEITDSNPNVTVKYYLNEAQALLGSSPLYPIYKIFTNAPAEFYTRVENENGCFSIANFTVNVVLPWAEFNTNEIDYEICNSGNDFIDIRLINDNFDSINTDLNISWYNEDQLIPGENGLELRINKSGTYTAKITSNDSNCSFNLSVYVAEKGCLGSTQIPQGISPNNDGINDLLDLRTFNIKRLEIFNRNGVLVYTKNNYTTQWHGQSDNGNELPVGTYFYTVIMEDGTNKSDWIFINR